MPQPDIEDTQQWLLAFFEEFDTREDLSWLVKVEDASVLLPDRLVKFLSSFDHAEPLLLGSRLISGKTVFVSSAGFALSRGALERLRPQGLVEVKSVPRAPDVGIATLCKMHDVAMPDTRDAAGGERFLAFPPVVAARGVYHDWYITYKEKVGHPALTGPACCAADAVLFHYVGASEQASIPGDIGGQQLVAAGWQWSRPTFFEMIWRIPQVDDDGAEAALRNKLAGWRTEAANVVHAS